ncbi:MAG: outer membrane beta-barrel protein [Spirosomataceae bacterium]
MNKKLLFGFLVLYCAVETAFAQRQTTPARYQQAVQRSYIYESGPSHYFRKIEMGFRFAPLLSANSLETDGVFDGTVNNGAAMRMSIGPYGDLFFAENYAFGTGLFYTVKRASVLTPKSFPKEVGVSSEGSYNLQYLQIPLTIKMFTNELVRDTRFYVQCGGLAEVKLAEKPLDKNVNALYRYYQTTSAPGEVLRLFSFADFGMVLGIGAEYEIGGGLRLLTGLTYNRGLTDVMRDKNLSMKNNVFCFDLGVKF